MHLKSQILSVSFLKAFLTGLFFFITFTQTVSGQADRRSVRQGNRLYREQQFADAEIKFRESLEKNSQMIEGMFNLGNSLYRQERFKEASQKFEALTRISQEDKKRAYAYHNWGNSLLKSQDFAGSVNAYKNALRINPMDDQTRFNLAYALQRLREQQNQSGQDNREQNEQNRQEQDNDQKRNEQPQQNQDQQAQPRQGQLSKQEAERILDALNQREQDLQQQLNNQNTRRSPVVHERDW